MWRTGLELQGTVGGRESQAYFDMAPVSGAPEQISGIVVFPAERRHEPLADAAIGFAGPLSDNGCGVALKEPGGEADGAVWQLRIERVGLVEATLTADGRVDKAVLHVVPETPCDGAGGWRTFSSPQWPIMFDYPANWVLTADQDDVNIECPSVTRLAAGGAWLTFERGRFPLQDGGVSAERDPSFTEPYWFVRRPNDDWRVDDRRCTDRAADTEPGLHCPPARRSTLNGITVLQGAAGEHRLYRPGVGYLGPGSGITRYLFVRDDSWVSLDSTGASAHGDDVGAAGGPVLLDGSAVGDRVVRSIRPR